MDDASQVPSGTPPAPKPERGIACPRCGCRHLRTTHTEPLPSGRIRRRKVCRHCGRRMVTYELAPRMVGPDR
ncbi:NrdR family transcriptional regulator [Thermopirellula anaerolimosa]